MLFVASPMYSLSSRVWSAQIAIAPTPAGPGFPLQAARPSARQQAA